MEEVSYVVTCSRQVTESLSGSGRQAPATNFTFMVKFQAKVQVVYSTGVHLGLE